MRSHASFAPPRSCVDPTHLEGDLRPMGLADVFRRLEVQIAEAPTPGVLADASTA